MKLLRQKVRSAAARVLPESVKFRLRPFMNRVPEKHRYSKQHSDQLNRILSDNRDMPVIVFKPITDWHLKLFQRPQHIALNLSKSGFLYFFCTGNFYENVDGFEKISESGYVTDRYDMLAALPRRKILHLYSTDNWTGYDLVQRELASGNIILYEYVDEIHEKVSVRKIPDFVFERHEKILSDERCIVVATADKLYQDVLAKRSRNCALVTNGVDVAHFSGSPENPAPPGAMRQPVRPGVPVIGYFGALASWFDFDLVRKLAGEREWQVVLIGHNYDNTMKKYRFDKLANLTVLKPVPYARLPEYAKWFDVAIIPFKLNEITRSTSPIKLFEYMALGKPIVTTDLPECRKYDAVLVGKDHDDFIRKVEQALPLKGDERYKARLKQTAVQNSWERKAQKIAELIHRNLVS